MIEVVNSRDATNEEIKRANMDNYPVLTLCGSTKFKKEIMEMEKKLTLRGFIVLSVGCFGHSGDEESWDDDMKVMLDDMHKRKIDMSTGIFVVNLGGYIGDSAKSEIEYAISIGKFVEYLEEPGGE